MNRHARNRAGKLDTLNPEQLAAVEDFVEFLRMRAQDRALTRAAAAVGAPAFESVWHNTSERTGLAGLAGPWFIEQAIDTARAESLPPLAHRLDMHLHLPRHIAAAVSFTQAQVGRRNSRTRRIARPLGPLTPVH